MSFRNVHAIQAEVARITFGKLAFEHVTEKFLEHVRAAAQQEADRIAPGKFVASARRSFDGTAVSITLNIINPSDLYVRVED